MTWRLASALAVFVVAAAVVVGSAWFVFLRGPDCPSDDAFVAAMRAEGYDACGDQLD